MTYSADRASKYRKAELHNMNVESELTANKHLEEKIMEGMGDSTIDLKKLQIEFERLQTLYKSSFFSDYKLLMSRNWGHLYPFSSLSDVEKVEATVRGAFVFSTVLLIYTNIGRITSGERYLPTDFSYLSITKSILFSNLLWIALTVVCVGTYIYWKRREILKQIDAVYVKIIDHPVVIAKKTEELKMNAIQKQVTELDNVVFDQNDNPMFQNTFREPLRTKFDGSTHMGSSLFTP